MKKGIFITMLVLLICQGCYSKEKNSKNQEYTVEQLFRSFSKEKKTVHVKVGEFAFSIASIFEDTRGVKDVEVFAFEECENDIKQRFNDAIKNLKDKSYETLVSTSENGERTKILVKIKDDIINEVVVLTGGDEPVLIRIKGKIKPDDVKSVVQNIR
jgi:hypothetical protein